MKLDCHAHDDTPPRPPRLTRGSPDDAQRRTGRSAGREARPLPIDVELVHPQDQWSEMRADPKFHDEPHAGRSLRATANDDARRAGLDDRGGYVADVRVQETSVLAVVEPAARYEPLLPGVQPAPG